MNSHITIEELVSMCEGLWEDTEILKAGSLYLFRPKEIHKFQNMCVHRVYVPLTYDPWRGFETHEPEVKVKLYIHKASEASKLSLMFKKVAEQFQFFERTLKDKTLDEPYQDNFKSSDLETIASLLLDRSIRASTMPSHLPETFDVRRLIHAIPSLKGFPKTLSACLTYQFEMFRANYEKSDSVGRTESITKAYSWDDLTRDLTESQGS